MVKNVIFLAVFLFGYTVQAITGFAGNIFCMPVGTLTLGLQSSVSILNATGFLACTVLAALNIRSIHWRELGKIVGVMLPFVGLGAWLDSVVPLHALLKIYGLVILAVGIKNLVQRKQSFLPEWALWGVLVAAGLSSSAGQARRDIDGGGVKVDGEALPAKSYNVDPSLLKKGAVLQVGKRHFTRLA